MTMDKKVNISGGGVATTLAPQQEKAWKSHGRMKALSKPGVVLVILLMIYAGFGAVYYQKHSESSDMKSQLALDQKTLSQSVPKDLSQLEKQKADMEANIAQASNTLKSLYIPMPEQGVDITSQILALARSANPSNQDDIRIVSLNSSIATKGSEGSIILRYGLTLSGSREALLDFITASGSAQGVLSTAKINSLVLADNGASSTLQMDFSVYTWPEISATNSTQDSGGGK